MGSIAFHTSAIKKQLEAKKGWLYIARDNAKTKTMRRKYQKQINEISAQLRKIS